MEPSDLEKVRAMVKRVATSAPYELNDRRVERYAKWLREAAAGRTLSEMQEAELQKVLAADLVCPGLRDVVPRLWHALDAEGAAFELVERIEEACELFGVADGRLLAFVSPIAVRLTSRTERRWRVPLTSRLDKVPFVHLVARGSGATRAVLDPNVYDGPMLAAIAPQHVKAHLERLMTAQGGAVPSQPLVEPIVLRAVPEPWWDVVYRLGVAHFPSTGPVALRNKIVNAALADVLFMAEIAFPVPIEPLIACAIGWELKCLGFYGWHEGLRQGEASLRRFRLGQQQFVGDSARHRIRSDGGR